MIYDISVIGSGIVGLASALKILERKPGLKIQIIDKEAGPAFHQTGHNSGVIHSGLYYKPGSLKTTNCIHGYSLLLKFCDEYEVPYELCGKIIVATAESQLKTLETLYERGVQNGLQNLRKLSAEEVKEFEPHASGVRGLHVPQTGIIDFKKVAEKMLELIQKIGCDVHYSEPVKKIVKQSGGNLIITPKNTYRSRLIVNCAGLHSDRIARMTGVAPTFKIIPFRGEYYKIKKEKRHLVKNLIYPVPDPAFPFLGVHFTRMINGGVEAGPNAVLALAREGYKKTNVNIRDIVESLTWPGFQKVAMKYWKTGLGEIHRSFSKKAFTDALRVLLPQIELEDLEPGGSGVRAQACDRDGGLIDDFLIIENDFAVNVCNAPSPAATSSLSIGETIAKIAIQRFNSVSSYKF
jgi:L-2-hydroxyglutarate oxidase